MLLKAQLKERLSVIRKAFDKAVKEKEAAANKEAVSNFEKYFQEHPDATGYVENVRVDGNAKASEYGLIDNCLCSYIQALQTIVVQAKKLGKAVYVFSADVEGTRVAHVNFVPPQLKSKGLEARTWADKVTLILGGKAGGKEESLQGVGSEVGRLNEAVEEAKKYLHEVVA